MSGAHADVRALRASVGGAVQGVGFREATRRRAEELGLRGWVRNVEDGSVALHAEGAAADLESLRAFLQTGPRGATVEEVEAQEVPVEGHEQFAIRGVSAGRFVVLRRVGGPSGRFALGLEVGGAIRSWELSRSPSLDPSVRRLAVEVTGGALEPGAREWAPASEQADVWDHGDYEQGGRVPWPQALVRGHAVFVLHGEKLRGGFALQRTRPGAKPQWLLIKRRDEHARPGSDVVIEQP